MKFVFFYCFIALATFNLNAQDTLQTPENIVDKINSVEPGKGVVRIIQDETITDRIGKPGKLSSTVNTNSGSDSYVEISGWRIQVFAGNNQRVSKNEAFHKEADIKSIHSDLGTYVTYTAPFWRLRVGDFQTYQDARSVLLQLRRDFPSYGREMSIVKDKVLIKAE